jgi:hypothetical protein
VSATRRDETILEQHGLASSRQFSLNSPAASFPCSLFVPAVQSPLSALTTVSRLLLKRVDPKIHTRHNILATTPPTTVTPNPPRVPQPARQICSKQLGSTHSRGRNVLGVHTLGRLRGETTAGVAFSLPRGHRVRDMSYPGCVKKKSSSRRWVRIQGVVGWGAIPVWATVVGAGCHAQANVNVRHTPTPGFGGQNTDKSCGTGTGTGTASIQSEAPLARYPLPEVVCIICPRVLPCREIYSGPHCMYL